MTNFIEVHCDGERRLVNTAWIEEIWEENSHKATIYFAFSATNDYAQDFIKTDETYSEVKEKIFA